MWEPHESPYRPPLAPGPKPPRSWRRIADLALGGVHALAFAVSVLGIVVAKDARAALGVGIFAAIFGSSALGLFGAARRTIRALAILPSAALWLFLGAVVIRKALASRSNPGHLAPAVINLAFGLAFVAIGFLCGESSVRGWRRRRP